MCIITSNADLVLGVVIAGWIIRAIPLAIGPSLILLLQGFLCGYLAMTMVTNNLQRGIAVVMGAILAVQGATWGLAIGLGLYIIRVSINQAKRSFAGHRKRRN